MKDIKEFIVDDENREMFKVFCSLHPHEAYELNPEAFIAHCKDLNPDATEEEIIKLLEETK
jgi:hypothetical protein